MLRTHGSRSGSTLCRLSIGRDERELQRREEKIGHGCLWSRSGGTLVGHEMRKKGRKWATVASGVGAVVRLSDAKRERKGESGPQLPDLDEARRRGFYTHFQSQILGSRSQGKVKE